MSASCVFKPFVINFMVLYPYSLIFGVGMDKRVTTESFISKAKEVHGTRYNYEKVKYVNARTKVTIICPVHGEFEQLPNNHLKYHCNKCGNIATGANGTLKTNEFVEKAKSVHGDRYDYTNVQYSKSKERVIIICSEHGRFKQTPSDHLQGKGCSKCRDAKLSTNPWSYADWENRGKSSKNFDSFKVYIIKCWNDVETFYKIGKTYVPIEIRFKNNTEMPYKWELVQKYEGDALAMSKLEKKLQSEHKEYSYVPKLTFGGKYECFSSVVLLNSSQ